VGLGKEKRAGPRDPKSEREYRDALADRLPAFAVLESFESAVKMRSWIGRDEESISEDVRNFGGAFHADAFQSNAFQLGMAGVEDREGAVHLAPELIDECWTSSRRRWPP